MFIWKIPHYCSISFPLSGTWQLELHCISKLCRILASEDDRLRSYILWSDGTFHPSISHPPISPQPRSARGEESAVTETRRSTNARSHMKMHDSEITYLKWLRKRREWLLKPMLTVPQGLPHTHTDTVQKYKLRCKHLLRIQIQSPQLPYIKIDTQI